MDGIIRIVPIFDQSAPTVWADFLRIQRDTTSVVYNPEMSDALCRDALDEYARDFKNAGAFAFGAYDADKMVGFIRGNIERASMYIAGVYILPEYRGMRLGSRLLNAAERSASLATGYSELHAITGVETFYAQKRTGYSCSYSNVYTKPIHKMGRSGTVPVFRLNSGLSRAVKQMLAPYDIQLGKHMPVFVYMDADFKPIGVAVSKSDKFHDGITVISDAAPAPLVNMVRRNLDNAIKPFTDR